MRYPPLENSSIPCTRLSPVGNTRTFLTHAIYTNSAAATLRVETGNSSLENSFSISGSIHSRPYTRTGMLRLKGVIDQQESFETGGRASRVKRLNVVFPKVIEFLIYCTGVSWLCISTGERHNNLLLKIVVVSRR